VAFFVQDGLSLFDFSFSLLLHSLTFTLMKLDLTKYPVLNFYPLPESAVLTKNGANYIYDIIRKKWLPLTPEEWVRQHLIFELLQKGYPPLTISVEKSFKVYNTEKRFDAAVFGRNGILILFECKKAGDVISDRVLQQAIRYNLALRSSYIGLTNGFDHYIYRCNQQQYTLESCQIPDFVTLNQTR
jgi:hypothetical protein